MAGVNTVNMPEEKNKKATALLLMFLRDDHIFLINSRDLHRHNYVPGKGELKK